MSKINNVLPREIKNSIRAMKNDDRLVDVIWARLAAYHDMRGIELLQMPMADAKAETRAIQDAIKRLKSAIRLAGHEDKIPRATLHAIDALEVQYAERAAYLESIKKRKTKNTALRSLAANLASVFDAYELPPRALAGFIIQHIAAISPAADTPPKDRVIRLAVKHAKRNCT